jgi:Fe-Mn family superoxide dismutase
MAVELPKLPYAMDALEPYISRTTLEFHYGRHHKKYVETVNQLVEGTNLGKLGLLEIMQASHRQKADLYNNAAQAWNHAFLWDCMSEPGEGPSLALRHEIERDFENLGEFKNRFATEAKSLFGSGWIWLVVDARGKLQIRSLSNAGNPIVEMNENPIMVCDLWEHAYYLDYQNERPKYLENVWSVMNWDFMERNLAFERGKASRSSNRPADTDAHFPH